MLSLKALKNKELSPSDHAGAENPVSPMKGRIKSPSEGPYLCSRWLEAVSQGKRAAGSVPPGSGFILPQTVCSRGDATRSRAGDASPGTGHRDGRFPSWIYKKALSNDL